MITDPDIRDRAYQYFLEEAPALLETIEEEIFALNSDSIDAKTRPLRVNTLMRATHTLKGGAANVGLETIKTVAHSMEDVFKALYNPDLVIDAEIKKLLYESYECLRIPLTAELSKTSIDRSEILDRTATVFAQLQEKFGDYLVDQDAFPTSAELGLDVVESFFQAVIPERIQELSIALAAANPQHIAETLQLQADIFLGLAESLELPGFGEIAKTILTALQQYPQRAEEIAELAIANLRQAQQQVLNGDRALGGQPSEALLQLLNHSVSPKLEELWLPRSEQDEPFIEINAEEAEDFSNDFETDTELTIIQLNIATESSEENHPSELLSEIWGEEIVSEPESIDDTIIQTDEIITSQAQQSESEPSLDKEINHNQAEETIAQVTLESDQIQPETIEVDSLPTTIAKIGNISKQSSTNKTPNNQTVRVHLESLEKLNDLIGELLINQNQNVSKDEEIYNAIQKLVEQINHNEQIINQLIDLADEISLSEQQQKILQELPEKLTQITNQSNFLIQSSQKIERNKQLNQLLQQATDSNSHLARIADHLKNFNKQSRNNVQKQQRMLLNMRDELIETRMSPLGRIFNRFPRLIEQLLTSYDKQVDLKISGSHVLVDKAVEEKLYDPLLHLIRNAFDHGIESPAARSQSGKPSKGTIELRAYYQGNQTIIEVKDDGQGLNLEKIKQRGIERNLITPQQANSSNPSQLLELLFEPGFSTADRVSDLSGRGVGLDVVRSQIEAINGAIAIESTPNQGTIFALQIPLTLTIAKLMLTQAKGMTYALLIDSIERIVIPTSNQVKIFEGQKVLHWEHNGNNEIIPVRSLASLMEYCRTTQQQTDLSQENEYKPILLLHRQGGLLGLEVDRVLGEQELVIRPLGSAIAPPRYVYGCSILKDSSLTLVIDGAALHREFEYRSLSLNQRSFLGTQTQRALPSESEQSQPLLESSSASEIISQTLLVVDDSSSLRQTIAMSLQKISNQVIQAENGLNALEKLHQSEEIGLVVCDLEMPFMNGFQFLKAIRQHHNFSNIPVIILTSRDSAKHRKLALELGAAAYLIKPYREEELLDTIVKILNASNLKAQAFI
ncbi:CheA signal transduction histidine kinase [Stanieria cyanosphaera PCC 7437]|uniref:histidine kinase n=1 Tax=Stanieria cyanosphaera (strain ATCC 29371 / PCC 7437) TaxID=111780 RepID=K9XW36_STAC7|nr:hybrid sensor histidine kinase/response regulator [Stanieria cyanosphaera]AFZ36301.1 CheA signal transduction histidine kinase [Stanieria cyanosphaera PCC 7437]